MIRELMICAITSVLVGCSNSGTDSGANAGADPAASHSLVGTWNCDDGSDFAFNEESVTMYKDDLPILAGEYAADGLSLRIGWTDAWVYKADVERLLNVPAALYVSQSIANGKVTAQEGHSLLTKGHYIGKEDSQHTFDIKSIADGSLGIALREYRRNGEVRPCNAIGKLISCSSAKARSATNSATNSGTVNSKDKKLPAQFVCNKAQDGVPTVWETAEYNVQTTEVAPLNEFSFSARSLETIWSGGPAVGDEVFDHEGLVVVSFSYMLDLSTLRPPVVKEEIPGNGAFLEISPFAEVEDHSMKDEGGSTFPAKRFRTHLNFHVNPDIPIVDEDVLCVVENKDAPKLTQ